MWPFKNQKSFTLLSDASEDELKTELLAQTFEVKRNTIRVLKFHAIFAFLHVLIAMFWLSSLLLHHSSPEMLLPLELPGVSEAIEYETVKFQVSGGGTREHPATSYEGPPTPEKDMRWWKLVNVGFIALTPEMNKTLRYPTESVSEDNQTPLVGLEIFHQLHCLNSIRKVVYGSDQFFNPYDRQDQIHLDHCLDYIRQVLMCHADVTPISNKKRPEGYNPLLGEWMPDFAVHHTCRNFDKIHAWAAKYNTSGFTLEPWPGVDPGQGLRTKPRPTAHVGSV